MRAVFACLVAMVLAGCAGAPVSGPPSGAAPGAQAGERAAQTALKLIGTPYRYGGANPVEGFDCSGLVQWSFRQAGVALPHNTDALRLASQPIATAELRPGDLLFFDLESKKNSHVGIYAGGGEFVHAPSTGKDVRRDRLSTPYWRARLSESRRPRI